MKTIDQLFLVLVVVFTFNLDSEAVNKVSISETLPVLNEITVRTFGVSDTAIFVKANQIPAFIAKENQNLSAILKYMQITPYQFALYNDLPEDALNLSAGIVYYLRPKKNKASVPFHFLRPGETLWDVSQLYGIKLKSLLKKNRINTPLEVTYGQKVSLQKKISSIDAHNIDIELASSKVTDPWLYVKQRFITDYEEEKNALSGKVVISKDNDDTIEDGIHLAKEGDTYFSIAREYDITLLDLKEWNGFENYEKLEPGNQVFIANPFGKTESEPQSLFEVDKQDDQNENILLLEKDKLLKETTLNIENERGIEALNTSMIKTLEHKAKKGDYVYKLSDIYEVIPNDIIKWNSLTGKAWLYENDKVLIKKIEGLNYNPRIHTVRKGETLYAISGFYNATIRDLKNWNELNNTYTIFPGQDLIVSREGYKSKVEVSYDSLNNDEIRNTEKQINDNKTIEKKKSLNKSVNDKEFHFHTVERGENLYIIAKKYGLVLTDLMHWNKLTYSDEITEGQILKVRKKSNTNLE